MLTQIKNAKFYLQAKLGLSQRGAEMVEYAIVLACIAALGVAYYATGNTEGTGTSGLKKALDDLWTSISGNVTKIK
ncbi:Flp family type IVb pilin [uncultured Phascolarctobacterium sp.]|uniref:Flp family type IVb pilin n=1 Tax=uncultured Phascolarctobacterium sp. TaxID=512296 RepID=UPI0025FEE396|nr:hypothetical protein [uncultured Phascolarctobacterium sp.]